jgi:hypothetical protein
LALAVLRAAVLAHDLELSEMLLVGEAAGAARVQFQKNQAREKQMRE